MDNRRANLVSANADVEVGLVAEHGGVGEGEVAELVVGVGGVGDELAEEDVAVGVERLDDDVEELVHLSLGEDDQWGVSEERGERFEDQEE